MSLGAAAGRHAAASVDLMNSGGVWPARTAARSIAWASGAMRGMRRMIVRSGPRRVGCGIYNVYKCYTSRVKKNLETVTMRETKTARNSRPERCLYFSAIFARVSDCIARAALHHGSRRWATWLAGFSRLVPGRQAGENNHLPPVSAGRPASEEKTYEPPND